MKGHFLALATALSLSAAAITTAHAQRFEVGPGGVYVGGGGHDGYGRDRYRDSYNQYRGGGDSCGMWRHECARNWGTGQMFDVCMGRRAAVRACGG